MEFSDEFSALNLLHFYQTSGEVSQSFTAGMHLLEELVSFFFCSFALGDVLSRAE
jgi:hypothetical protein